MAIKWLPAIRGQSSQSKAIANVGTPPAQGVFGDISFLGGRHHRAAGTRPGQFRSSGRRLPEFAGHVGRSGRLRAGVRTRPALPGLELQLSDRYRKQRGVLAEEQRAGAG
jgi:hypothetical protein